MDRIFLSFSASCLAVVLAAPYAIKLLRKLKLGQFVRDDGPSTHLVKQGTPSMGGLIMAFAAGVAMLLFVPLGSDVYIMAVTAGGFALIGFFDDYLKVRHKASLGLKGRFKFLGQVAFSAILAIYAYRVGGGALGIPFVTRTFELGPFYVPFAMFIVIGAANGVNFADGVDGLASGAAAMSIATYGVIAYLQGQMGLASLAAALVGACLAFLLFNSHPASIFMGDTGSLGLGGAIGALAVLTRNEVLLALVGLLYVIEILSSVIQVYYIRKLNRRLFRMAPIHHHFELLGYPEAHVAAGFWIFSAICGALSLVIYLRG